MKILHVFPVLALASLFAVLVPNSAKAISGYQSGYDDGYAAAQDSHGVYAIGDACEHQSTQYCNGFLAGYTTEFFALYQNLPTTVIVHEAGPNVVIIHPHQYYYPHTPFIVIHRPFFIHPHSHFLIGPTYHHAPVFIQPHPYFLGHGLIGPYNGRFGPGSEEHHDH